MGFREFLGFRKPAPIVQLPKYSQPMEMIATFLANGQVVWFDNNAQGNIDEGFLGNHIVFTIQDKKSSKVASAPPLVYEVKEEKTYKKYRAFLSEPTVDSFRRSQDIKHKALEEIEGHDMQKVLDRPNPHMSRYEFEYGMQTYIDIVGAGYYMGVRDGLNPEEGRIKEMYLPPAHHMTIVTGDITNPIKEWFLSSSPQNKISAKNVCQVRNFSPRYETQTQWMYGLSRLFSAKGLIQKYKDGSSTEVGLYQNNGRQDIIFPEMKDADPNEYSLEQMQAIRDGVTSSLKSSGISASTIPLGTIRVGFSPAELGILESLQDAKIDLCALYHLPPEMFGWGEHSTYNNMTEKRKIGLTDAVLPELEKRKDALNHWLVPSYNEKGKHKLVIDYDYEYFPELQADNAEIVKWMEHVPMTANERRALFRYDTIPGDNNDKLLVGTNVKLLEDMGIDSFAGGFEDGETENI